MARANPRGLRGEQIPLGARIFTIADSLDANDQRSTLPQGAANCSLRAPPERNVAAAPEPSFESEGSRTYSCPSRNNTGWDLREKPRLPVPPRHT